MPLRKMIAKLQEKWSGRIAPRRAPRLKSRRTLELELLESRDLMSVTVAPKILAVTPPDGGSLVETASPNVVKITYSEAMNTAQATNPNNYLLFGPAGNAVPVTSVTEEGATNVYDVTFAAGNPEGAYTLFVKGDQVDASAANGGLPLANPGQLVVATSGAGTNSVSTVSAPDGFTPGTPTTLGATQTYAMGPNAGGFFSPNPIATAIGDFNGDGNLDLAIVSNSPNINSNSEVDIYTGKASGGFDATPALRLNLPVTAGLPVSLVAFSPSTRPTGFADLAVLDSTNNVDVFTNTAIAGAVPTFNVVAVDPTGAARAVAFTTGDFNRDGITDLAVLDGNADGNGNFNIDFLAGTGGGAFGGAVKFAVGNTANAATTLQNPTSIAEGSLRNATSTDLAVGGSNGVETILGNNTFAPTIGQLINSTTPGSTGLLDNVTSVAIGKLDGDSNAGATGAQDIAAASSAAGSTTVEVLMNADLGTGALNPAISKAFSLGGVVANALALSPQTPGGKADIVVATSAANEVTVLHNTATTSAPAFAAAVHYTVDTNPVGLAIGKLNGDTTPDIVTVNNVAPFGLTGGTFSVLRNNGDGTYGAPTVLTAASVTPDAVVVGDLNGDGIPDLVVANKAANTVTVYLASNTTPGTYAAGVTYSIKDLANNGSSPVSITLADLTGTGKLDIITANSGDNTISILASNGDGTFQTATTHAVGSNPTQVVAGMFDKSGHVSLAIAHNGSGSTVLARGVSLLLGNGDRTFKPIQEYLSGVNAVALVAGNFTSAVGAPLDLAVADTSNGTVDLLRNNGSGVFTHAVTDTYGVGASPSALAVGDFNRDGLQDVVAVSADATGSTQQIATLINSGGGGFAAAVFTALPFGFPIHSVAVADLNGFDFPSLVVGLTGATVPGRFGAGVPADADLYSLFGNGDGTFANPVPYMTGPKAANAVVAVASDPLVHVTTFTLVTNIVAVDLIKNGGFEAHDLNGTPGNFIGWQSAQVPNSRGGWYLQSGTLSPLSLTAVPPPSGGTGANNFQAMADQSNLKPIQPGVILVPNQPPVGGFNPNAPSSYSGSNFLYQDVTLPGSATSLTFSMNLYLNSDAAFTDGESSLFFNNPDDAADQQVRVDFIDPSAPITATNTSGAGSPGVLLSLFQTTSITPQIDSITLTLTPTQQAALNALITPGKSRTVRLRISEVNTQGRLTVGVDNVSLKTQYTDTTAPVLSGPQLRNVGYQVTVAGGATITSTTDPTLTGQVSDDGGVANIKRVVFSPYSAAVDPFFNLPGDAVIGPAGLDATGHFTVNLPGLAPSQNPYNIRAKVFDFAGNSSGESTIAFVYQAASNTNFQAVGPGPINVTGVTGDRFTAVEYNSVVGRINSVIVDPTDPTGNTYVTAGDNGGIWRTTDGGVDWTPTTDYVFNPNTGAPINVPIGSMGGAINHTTNKFVIYAGLGDGDIQPTARAGSGVLVSTNGGVSWALAGNSDTVLAGARISKVAVDPNNTQIAYVAVESGGSSGPGVYKTTDGGLHWANVLTLASIHLPAPINSFPAGTTLASVTDLAINPFDSTEVTIALGNIGLVAASPTAGVYRTIDGGADWSVVTGGRAGILNDTLPGPITFNGSTPVYSPAVSMTIGRVTLAYAAGITNDTSTLYVLVTSVPAANPLPGGNVLFGNGQAGTNDEPKAGPTGGHNTPNIFGLYKSGNQTLGITAFTHVMVREQQGGPAPDISPWKDINFSNLDASNTGAITVDPTDPNVVYIGGSEEYGLASAGDNHGLLRIDTGNMVDTSYLDDTGANEGFLNNGDDITKRRAAFDSDKDETPPAVFEYPTTHDQGYTGEGVSWLDITTNVFNNAFGFGGTRLPPNITSVAFDSQGRIIFGTEQGLFRLVYQGTGYDFTSGGTGIVAQVAARTGGGLSAATLPTSLIQLSQIDGNLQISDLSSVAIDPTIASRLYTTQYNTGAAVSTGGLGFTSSGLQSEAFNPIPDGLVAGIPDGDRVVVAQPDPTAPAGTLNTIYEAFAFGDVGSQENFQLYSSTQGGAFQSIVNVPTAGFGRDNAGYLPVLAIDPNKIFAFVPAANKFEYLDGLLFGTDRIYVSRTSGAQFTALTNGPLSTKGGVITAAAFAPSNDQVIWATTDKGEVFVTVFDPVSQGYSFKERDTGLPAGQRINSVTVDPTNSNIAFITETTAAGVGQVFKTINGGASWTNITGNLPKVNYYTLVTDPRPEPGSGAPIGHLYVGTDVGAYVSVDGGAHWTVLGVGLPHVPVTDLQFNQKMELLVAGTQGRGAFELSTDVTGAHVVGISPSTPVNTLITGPLSSITITFNKSISSFPLSAVDFITGPNGPITPLSVTDVSTAPPGFPSPHNAWQITFAPQTTDGTYTIQIGPNILDQLGHALDQNQNAINGEDPGDRFTFHVALNSTDDGQFVTGQYHDELGRPADTDGFITILTPIDVARYSVLANYAFAYVRDLGRAQLVQDLYGPSGPSIIGVGDLLGRAAAPSEISYWVSQLQNGLSYEQMIVSLAGSSDFFAQAGVNGNDVNFVTQLGNDLLHPNPNSAGEVALYVPQLANAESIARTQDARTLLSGQGPQGYETLFIKSVYQEFLNRAPTSSEIGAQLNVFNQGGTQEQIIAALLGSSEYFNVDAPAVVGGGATPSNTTLVQAMYDQLFAGYPVTQAQVNSLANLLTNGTYTAQQLANILDTTDLYRFGTPTTTGNKGLVYTAYQTYLGRAPSTDELNHWEAVYAAIPNYRTEDLYAVILGSGEYFVHNTTAGQPLPSQDQQFADALYTSVLGATNPTAESTTDLPFLASQESLARDAVAQALLGSPDYHNDVTTYVYKTFLGRLPSAGELATWLPVVGQSGTPGGPNGDERLLDAVFSSSEYFLHQTPDANHLHTNDTWLRSLYTNLHVPFNANQEAFNLGNIGLAYGQARLNAIQTFQTSPEYYVHITAVDYSVYLGRAPGASEVNFWISQFQAGETQEQQIASLISSQEFFLRGPAILGDLTLTPSNKTFVDSTYKLLFPGYTAQPSDEQAFVPALNNGTISRLQVAQTLIGSFQYRFGFSSGAGVSIPNNGLIERAYQQYLGRAISMGPGSELSYWESVYAANPAYPTTTFLATLFDSPEYLDKTHQFP